MGPGGFASSAITPAGSSTLCRGTVCGACLAASVTERGALPAVPSCPALPRRGGRWPGPHTPFRRQRKHFLAPCHGGLTAAVSELLS